MKRIGEFDSLRGIAAVAVLLHHCTVRGFSFGGLGVNLFFVLSGYLITRIIIDRMGEGGFLLNFYARRSLRIWPIYYLTLAALALINLVAMSPPLPMRGAAWFLAYMQYVPNYWGGAQPPFLTPSLIGHTWTLAVEEQFYLIWPALILALGRRSIPAVSAACIIAAVAARARGFKPELLLAQSDSLALGGLLASVLSDQVRVAGRRRPLTYFFGGLTLVAAATTFAIYGGLIDWGVTRLPWDRWPPAALLIVNLAFTGLVGLVALHSGSPWLSALRNRFLCYLGQISYGFYLYHVPILTFTTWAALRYGGPDVLFNRRANLLRLGAVFLLTLGAAVFSWELIEKPLLRLKDRFRYDRRPVPKDDPHRSADPSEHRRT